MVKGLEWAHGDVRFAVVSCVANTAGDFAGNIDVDVSCDAALRDVLLRDLAMRLPGEEASAAIARGDTPGGVGLVYHSRRFADGGEVPAAAEFLWQGTPIGSLPCREAGGSRPSAETVEYLSPREARARAGARRRGGHPLMGTPVPLGRGPGPAFLLVAAFLVSVGAFMVFYGLASQASDRNLSLALGAVIALGGALFYRFAPHRQSFFNPLSGRIVTVRGAWLFGRILWRREEERSPGEFHHLRIVETAAEVVRTRVGTSVSRRTDVWEVTLEGPISRTDGEGRMHRRQDALRLGSCATHGDALEMAADVAEVLGVSVVDSGRMWV